MQQLRVVCDSNVAYTHQLLSHVKPKGELHFGAHSHLHLAEQVVPVGGGAAITGRDLAKLSAADIMAKPEVTAALAAITAHLPADVILGPAVGGGGVGAGQGCHFDNPLAAGADPVGIEVYVDNTPVPGTAAQHTAYAYATSSSGVTSLTEGPKNPEDKLKYAIQMAKAFAEHVPEAERATRRPVPTGQNAEERAIMSAALCVVGFNPYLGDAPPYRVKAYIGQLNKLGLGAASIATPEKNEKLTEKTDKITGAMQADSPPAPTMPRMR